MRSEQSFAPSKYGTLESARLKSKLAYDLVNRISAKFGCSISWDSKTRFNRINRHPGQKSLFFKFHSNKFVPYLEFLSEDIPVLHQLKQSFPEYFVSDVIVKEGLL